MIFIQILISLLLVSQICLAQDSTEVVDGPCMKIMDACKNAGYNKPSSKDKKSLSKDCIQPLLAGKKVEGVNVEAADVAACQAKKSEVKQKK